LNTTGSTALTVIAVAVSLQTLLVSMAVVALLVVWRRASSTVDAKFDALSTRVDEALTEARSAAVALDVQSAGEPAARRHWPRHTYAGLRRRGTAGAVDAGCGVGGFGVLSRWRKSRHNLKTSS
jgi:hypothetical protein